MEYHDKTRCVVTVSMCNIDEFKRHGCSTLHSVEISAGGAETAFAAEKDKLKLPAVWAAIHGTAEGGVAAVYHLIDIFHLSLSGMKGIFNFFIMVGKDFL